MGDLWEIWERQEHSCEDVLPEYSYVILLEAFEELDRVARGVAAGCVEGDRFFASILLFLTLQHLEN